MSTSESEQNGQPEEIILSVSGNCSGPDLPTSAGLFLWTAGSGVGNVCRCDPENHGKRVPRELSQGGVLYIAFGVSSTSERGSIRLMRWRRGEFSGQDLASVPGLG